MKIKEQTRKLAAGWT